MSDVRRELLDAICESYKEVYERPIFPPYAENLADAILGRIDVTPKQAISDYDLGTLMQEIEIGIDGLQYTKFRGDIGGRLRVALEEPGLKIVRVDE